MDGISTARIGSLSLVSASLLFAFPGALAQSSSDSAAGQGGNFINTPMKSQTDQTLQQTLRDIHSRESVDIISQAVQPKAEPPKAQPGPGIIAGPNAKIRFDGASSQDSRPAKSAAQAPSASAGSAPPSAVGKMKVKFNFKDADASAVVEFLAKLYGVMPLLPPSGFNLKISISTPGEVQLDEAFSIFTSVLNNFNYAVVRTDRYLKVVPKKDAQQLPLRIFYGTDEANLPDSDEMMTALIPCKNVPAAELVKYVAPLASGGAAQNSVSADSSSSILIMTDTASNIRRVLKFLKLVDIAPAPQGGDLVTSVYRINFLNAKSLADCLSNAFKIQSTLTVRDGSVVNNQVIIQPFQDSNTILVTANPDMQKAVGAAIKSLDQRKKQVLLNVRFLEATYDRNFYSGTSFAFHGGSSTVQTGPVADSTGSTLANSKASQLTYLLSSKNVDLTVQSLLENNKVKILSQPRLLTADNEAASLTVGSQYPILKSTTNVSQSTPMVVSDYSYLDLGIKLDVTPHINPDNDVTLNMDFKISSILSNVTVGTNTVPEIGTREVKTVLSVKDAHTLIICGIITKNYTENRSAPPGAGEIPWIGWMFGQEDEERTQTELIVLINPMVVEQVDDGDKLTETEKGKVDIKPEDFNNFKRFFDAKDKEDFLKSVNKPAENAGDGKTPATKPDDASKAAVEPEKAAAKKSGDEKAPEPKNPGDAKDAGKTNDAPAQAPDYPKAAVKSDEKAEPSAAPDAKDGGKADAEKAADAKAGDKKEEPSIFDGLFD